jgi:hypothetical protein
MTDAFRETALFSSQSTHLPHLRKLEAECARSRGQIIDNDHT